MLARYSHLTTKDARDALLRANGIDVPEERVDVGGIVSTEADLKPVVPLPGIRTKTAAGLEREHAAIVRELVDTIVGNPEALERLRRAFAELPSG